MDDSGSKTPAATASSARPTAIPPSWSTWDLNEQLRHVERVLAGAQSRGASTRTGRHLRFDAGHTWPAESQSVALRSPAGSSSSVVIVSTWLTLGLGMAALACGAVLSIWGWTAHRDELWDLGLPIVLIGQLGLLVGLLLQIDTWRNPNRHTPSPLAEFNEQLAAVQQRLSNPHS